MTRMALKGMLAHKLRVIITTLVVMIGVAFMVGSVILTESVRAEFDSLFEQNSAGIDFQVRGKEEFDTGSFGGFSGATLPDTDVALIESVPGVAAAAPTVGLPGVWVIDADGEAVRPANAPPLGFGWVEDTALSTLQVVEGTPPLQRGDVVVDITTAETAGLQVGQEVRINTPAGAGSYTLVGLVSFGETNATLGASLAAFTFEEAQEIFDLVGRVQWIDVRVEPGVPTAEVEASLNELFADRSDPGVEIVTNDAVVDEGQQSLGTFIDIFQNVLLGFAAITIFVAGFLISNTFNMVLGQRVRELALLRAIGATRAQLFRMVLIEALCIALLASFLGFLLGILVALGLNEILAAADFGAGDPQLLVTVAPLILALVVGVGVTLTFALLPAWRATTVPPVAAMREGFTLEGMRLRTRFILGSLVTAFGALQLLGGIASDVTGVQKAGTMATGAIIVFLGTSALSPVFAGPISRLLGAPLAALFGPVGRMAQGNAARNPRRTASSAAALMIGMALVSMVLVVGASIKSSFIDALGSSITADWYLDNDTGFVGFSPSIAQEIDALPQTGPTTGGRFGRMQVDDSTKDVQAVDFSVVESLFDLEIVDGSISDDAGLIVHEDPAADLALAVGDTVTATFNETGTVDLRVLAIHSQSSILGNWIIDLDTFNANFTDPSDFWVASTTAEGVSEEDARAAIEGVLVPFPEMVLESQEEYKDSSEAQLNIFLVVVNVFLLLAVVIAFIGIMLTLVLSVTERTREIGLLRAVGETRGQVWAMITFESMIVAVFGTLLGATLGIAFGLAINTALPADFLTVVTVPWLNLIILIVFSGLSGVVAAVFPAWRAARLNVLNAISSA